MTSDRLSNTPPALLRRTVVAFAALILTSLTGAAAERFMIEWINPDAAHPWLENVAVTGFEGATVRSERATGGAEYPNRISATLAGPDGKPAWAQVLLAHGYGFTFSDTMLHDQPYLWVRELGIFISRDGWSATAGARERAAASIRASEQVPFTSAAEQYYNWSGLTEHEPDDIHRFFWEFIDAKQSWPPSARVADRIAAMPEVDVAYFDERIPDLKYSKMFLGWQDHNDQFVLWSHGKITVSSQSVGGIDKMPADQWLPRARSYSVRLAVGDSPLPRYREYGDPNVHQRLENGHDLVAVTEWRDGGTGIRQTCFAVPVNGDTIRTGVEPLALWTRVTLTNEKPQARDAWFGIEFTDDDFTTFRTTLPLADVADIEWKDGAFSIGDRVIATADPSLEFEKLPAHGTMARFRVRVPLAASGTRSFTLTNLYRAGDAALLAKLKSQNYDAEHRRMLAYWDAVAARGASIHVPDERLNNLYRTFLPRITMCSAIDPQGMPVMHTGPIQYARVWHHITSIGIGGDLVRRGQFDLAKKYFEAIFKWQDLPAPDSPAITDWSGFFGAPPEQCPMVWMSYQGVVLWAAARYYEFSGDRAWLDEKLPALIRGMEWIERTRQLTKKLNPDGTKPLNYGWLPAGRAGDSVVGSSIYSDGSLWWGLDKMAGVLASIGHPRAGEFQADADDYRKCIVDGQRRSSQQRPLLRLNDDTWIPYLPTFIDSHGNERDPKIKHANVVDSAWAWVMLGSHLFGTRSAEAKWVMDAWEDDYTLMNPNLADEPFSSGIFDECLERDRIAEFIYTFYSLSTNTLDRETLTTFEHRSWGQKRAFELTPWAAGYWTMNFTNMLCRTVGDELWLLQATPRRWMNDGESIEVKGLQTEFGPITFSLRSHLAKGRIEATIDPPGRAKAGKLRLRLRLPEASKLRSVEVNGRSVRSFDAASGWIELPAGSARLQVTARVGR